LILSIGWRRKEEEKEKVQSPPPNPVYTKRPKRDKLNFNFSIFKFGSISRHLSAEISRKGRGVKGEGRRRIRSRRRTRRG